MSAGTETRMLERRVSNNRADLNSDQQLNYFLAWFQEWSDLQKSDFAPILASKMSSSPNHLHLNGVELKNQKPLSLFQCQLKLFKEWIGFWPQDKKDYLLIRLKDLDSNFFSKYESLLDSDSNGAENSPKDYFEPGIPAELIRTSRKNSPNVSLNEIGNTRLNSSHITISYALFCLKKKKKQVTLFKSILRLHHISSVIP